MKKLIYVSLSIILTFIGFNSWATKYSACNTILISLDSSDKGGDSGNHRG